MPRRVGLVYPYTAPDGRKGAGVPYGILVVAAILREAGHDVTFTDMTFCAGDHGALRAAVADREVVGFYVTSPLVPFLKACAASVRQAAPGARIIAGGPECYVDPRGVLAAGVDVAATGEAEPMAHALVEALAEGSDPARLPGVALMRKGRLVRTENAPVPKDLDAVPWAALDLVDLDAYVRAGCLSIPLSTTRGCPFDCAFCQPLTRNIFGRAIRRRSPEQVVDEMEHRAATAMRGRGLHFFLTDETFTADRKYAMRVCEEIVRRGLRLSWRTPTRVDCVDAELLRAMARAGCTEVLFGVESGSEKVLRFYRKGITTAQIKSAFAMAREAGISRFAYLIIGAPVETEEDLEMTERLVREIRPDGVSVARLTPKRGTHLERYAVEAECINVRESADLFHNSTGYPLRLEHLTLEDLDRWRDRLRRAAAESRPERPERRAGAGC